MSTDRTYNVGLTKDEIMIIMDLIQDIVDLGARGAIEVDKDDYIDIFKLLFNKLQEIRSLELA